MSAPRTCDNSFITYRSCTHLDHKHTVFGKVVGGLETLDKMEAVATDSKDKPKVRRRQKRNKVKEAGSLRTTGCGGEAGRSARALSVLMRNRTSAGVRDRCDKHRSQSRF